MTKQNVQYETKEKIDIMKTREEEEAIDYVDNIKAFHMNWIAYVILIPCLYFINQAVSPNHQWYPIVIIAWAFAIALHRAVIYFLFERFNTDWERDQINKRLGRNI